MGNMTSIIKIGDKVRNAYTGHAGIVTSIDADETAEYDLANRQIVRTSHPETLIVKVYVDCKTLDTLQPMTAQESFCADDLEVIA